MALTPHKPNPADEKAVEEYNKAVEDREKNPHKWALSPSVDTQLIKIQKQKREEIKKATEKPVEAPKKTTRKRTIK